MTSYAQTIASQSKLKQRLGAVLLKHGRVIGAGHNQLRHQSTLQTDHWSGSLHAEIACILDALRKTDLKTIKGSTLMVVRLKADGSMGLALPCPACYDVIQKMGIKKIMFSTNTGMSEIKV